MHRWHELLAEGDYGRPSETSARLVRLADKGPDAGIHVVAWTDGYATAERALRRAGIGFFGLRAVLRVLSPAESDALLGVSAAASLDDDRALYRDTEWPVEQVEKFKPYSTASLYAFAQEGFRRAGNGAQHDHRRAAATAVATSPYLGLRQAVRPAILAHRLLAGDQERAGKLAAECEDLLFLTRELLKAAGRAAHPRRRARPLRMPDEGGGDRQAQLLEAYADAGLLWAKVVGSSLALAGALIERGEWEDVRALAGFLAGAGEDSAAAELRIRSARRSGRAHREQLRAISNNMPPAAIEPAINALRAVLREVPEEFPDRNREVNRFLPPLASAIYALMKEQQAEIPYHSRVEHIATGGVAKYPDIVKMSLDELAAEFDGICRGPAGTTT